MESPLFERSSLKGCLNQDLSRPFQNLMHHGSDDGRSFYEASFSHEGPLSPIQRKGVGSRLSPGYNNPNLTCSGFSDRYNIYNPHQSSHIDPGGGSSLLVVSNGKNMPSLIDPKLISGEAVSPDQISSVTACSDAEWYSNKESLEFGATSAVRSLSEPASGDNLELDKYKAWLPEHISVFTPEYTDALSGMNFSKPELSHEQLSEYAPQALHSKQCHLQPCQPPTHFDFSLEAEMYRCSNDALYSMISNNPKLSHEQLFQYAPMSLQSNQCHLHPCQPPAHFDFSVKADIFGRGTDALSSMISSKPKLNHEQLFQYVPHAHQSKECHMQLSPPPAHYDFSSKPEMYGCSVGNQELQNEVGGERSLDQPHLSSERMHRFQQPGFYTVQVSRPRNPIRTHNVLVSYIKFKSKQLDASGSQQEFLHYLHAAVCRDLTCQCEKNRLLISHFEKCQNSDCNLCEPVRQLCHTEENNSIPVSKLAPIEKMTSGCGKPRGYLLGNHHPRDFIFQDIQPIPKRLKIENAVPHDDWSLGAAVLPHLIQRSGHLMDENKELLTSNDASTKGVTRDGAADNVRLKNANVHFNKTDELLGHGHLPEGSVNSSTLNKETPWSIGNLWRSHSAINGTSDDKVLGNSDTLSHSEELTLVDINQKMDCIIPGKIKTDETFYRQSPKSDGISGLPEEPKIDQGEKAKLISVPEHDTKCDSAKTDYQSGPKLKDSKLSGVSLTDFFTAEQIKEHLGSLNQWINTDIEKELNGNEAMNTAGANTCQLCAKDGLTFAAPPMYCSYCGVLIKHRLTYYWIVDERAAQHCFCTLCFNRSRGGNISFKGLTFSKAKLQKSKNIAEFEEAWVQCNKCERWQHQICALYNSKQDLEGTVDYICPICRLAEIEEKGHLSSPPAFGARVLPRTKLSDHIEQRLLRSLKHERKQRAELMGKSPEEVPGAADLVVRVVLAVNKQLQVKQQFLDIIPGESYPTEFPYKSKVILLFQKVEGVDVCLFAMYVQEYGSECGYPNKRSVYISYLDSVKYFRPETKTIAGVALRTFVYHEILIGYLDYCKQSGFTTCYIWACPPLRGEDYILYCHPETQKRPNMNKLCQWYKKMLRKAKEDNVVVEYTNFYDYFFVPSGDCNSKITAARLPYFDGDYWSGAIEDMIRTIEKDSRGDSERKLKSPMTKRTLKAMGHSELSVDATKDILVMQKLGHSILPVKEDFFVVHLQFTCTNCHEAILSGSRWSCNQCSKFHLCNRCLELKQILGGVETHTTINGEKHQLYQIPVTDVAADTEDKDVLLDNDFLDNRHSFLNFCQKNNYQFDTLRRAKHSSMMILHHLQKMTALTMQTICSICHQDAMVRWHCEICSKFHVCSPCFQKEGDRCHIHKLVQYLTEADCPTKSEQIQQQRPSELRAMLDLLKHANQCRATRDSPCSYPNCLHLKRLFKHNRECERSTGRGCNHCKRMWLLLRLHSDNCRDSNCQIPRCMDIKRHVEMIAAKSSLKLRASEN